ncbi:hypothetical protein BGZ93_002485 [Podila epicladia]|nr:hypothetical protein BGZ93_002485 [Podila epicladia]
MREDGGSADSSAESKRKKRKIEAEGLASNSKKFRRYRVEDDEADDSGKKMTYTLSTRSVIMIVDDQDAVPEFPAGHTVLALYPSTTCFYKAVVVQPPSKNKDYATPVYRIKFDDDGGSERTAPPRMVLDMPKTK